MLFGTPKSYYSNLVAVLGPTWPLPKGFSVPQNRSDTDIGTCLESPLVMQWTAPTRRHLGAKIVVFMNHRELGAVL